MFMISLSQPALLTERASAWLPKGGVAKVMQRSSDGSPAAAAAHNEPPAGTLVAGAGAARSPCSAPCSRRSVPSMATAPPSEWPHSTRRLLDAAALSHSSSTGKSRERDMKPLCAAGCALRGAPCTSNSSTAGWEPAAAGVYASDGSDTPRLSPVSHL